MAARASEYLKRYQSGEQLDLLDKWINAQLGRDGELELHRERFDYQITLIMLASAKDTFSEWKRMFLQGQEKELLVAYVKEASRHWPDSAAFLSAVRGHVINFNKRQVELRSPDSIMNRELAKMKKKTKG